MDTYMKQEAQFTTKIKSWLRDNVGTGAFEIKHTRGEDAFPMRELTELQRDALVAVRSRTGLAFKIPDEGVSYRPFDLFVFKQAAAWVVICYPKSFVVIDISKLVKWTAPSLHYNDAKGLASWLIPLSDLKYTGARIEGNNLDE